MLTAYKKEENGEEEGDALVDILVELIQKTPSFQVYKEFAGSVS